MRNGRERRRREDPKRYRLRGRSEFQNPHRPVDIATRARFDGAARVSRTRAVAVDSTSQSTLHATAVRTGPAVLVLCLAAHAVAIHVNVLGALGPFLGESLGVGGKRFGALLSAAALAGAVSSLLLGPVIDRIGRRPVLLWSIAVFAVASAAHFWATDYTSLLVARTVAGFAGGAAFTGASAAVADLVPYGQRGRAMTWFSGAVFLAVPVGLPVAVALANAGAWRVIFLVQAAVAAAAFAGAYRFIPGPPVVAADDPAPARTSQWQVLRAPQVVPVLLSIALYTGGFFTVVQFLPRWLDSTDLLPRQSQLTLWIVLGVVLAVGSMTLGKLADRVGKRTFVMWATAIVAAGVTALSQVESIAMLIVVGIPVGLVASARAGAFLALMTQLVPASVRGRLMGIRAAALNLGSGVIALLGGWLHEAFEPHGFEAVAFAGAGVLFVSFGLVVWLVREPEGA